LALDGDEVPEWMDDGKLGLDVYYDERTYDEMKKAVEGVIGAERDRTAELREILVGEKEAETLRRNPESRSHFNTAQNAALDLIHQSTDVAIIHGPPGTGKTTTLVQAIREAITPGQQLLVCAPSNLATDLLTEKLGATGVKVLRIGHPARVSEIVQQHSLDMQLRNHPRYKEMKSLRREAEQIRRQALKFKRKFGHEERQQRRTLLSDARGRQHEARDLEGFMLTSLLENASVITSTLTGAANKMLKDRRFAAVFIDEAAQALEPTCWIAIRKAERVVFAGDHCQLPPTVKSRTAEKGGFSHTLFEKVIADKSVDVMLDTQYRMHSQLMTFSSREFYKDALEAHSTVADHRLSTDANQPVLNLPLQFVDTAGCGFDEQQAPGATSLHNAGEATVLFQHLSQLRDTLPKDARPSIGLISPYKAQVNHLREQAAQHGHTDLAIDTVDGFQGNERDIIYISCVRSNRDGQIGFLSDIRRMNVAMTRARKKLVVVGDSATLAHHGFYQRWLAYFEEVGAYGSAWEFMSW
ncbi:MAG: AAA domain-containing protein, partial [Bacteroidota bacterium]